MSLPAGWKRALAYPRSRKVMLLTISPGGSDPSTMSPHLAEQPGSVTMATEAIHIEGTYGTVPFWPWLLEWPVTSYRLALRDRRAEVPTANVRIMAQADLPRLFAAGGTGRAATARLDLATDGLTLSGVLPRLAGKITDVSYPEGRNGPVNLTIADGDSDRNVPFPPEKLTPEAFPEAPAHVAGVEFRRFVVGSLHPFTLCHQIDQNGNQFYAYDLPEGAGSLPTKFHKGNTDITSHCSADFATDALGGSYVEIQLDLPIDQILPGEAPFLFCEDGAGITAENSFQMLLGRGGFKLSPQAQAKLRFSVNEFRMDSDFSGQSDVLSLIFDRLAPQTPFVFTFRNGQIDILTIGEETPERAMAIGSGLIHRVQADIQSEDAIFNVIRLQCGSGGLDNEGLVSILRDKDHAATARLRRILVGSEQRFGRRPPTPLRAIDLAVEYDSNGLPFRCPSGEKLADLLAELWATPGTPHRYLCNWLEGLTIDLNWRIRLTDSDEDLDDKLTRVVQIDLESTGPVITCEETAG